MLLLMAECTVKTLQFSSVLLTEQYSYCYCSLVNCTHTRPFNGPLSRTTRVGQYQKSKINLDFTEARESEWQWHQLGHIQYKIQIQNL